MSAKAPSVAGARSSRPRMTKLGPVGLPPRPVTFQDFETGNTPTSAANFNAVQDGLISIAAALASEAEAAALAGSLQGVLTVAAMHAMTAEAGRVYILFELGKEGFWRLDPADTTSAENVGTIIVTTGGQRLKRIIEPGSGYAPEWFGAKGDWKDTTATLGEGTDDTAAFQACVNALIAADAGRLMISRRYLIEGTVYLNQTGEALKWVPIDLHGLNDGAAGSRGHSCEIVRRKAGAVFSANLDAAGNAVLAPTEQWLGLSYKGFSFIGKSVEEKEGKGVPVLGMLGIQAFRTRCVQGDGMYASRFDYLMYQPDQDASAHENYCDGSTYNTCRISFSTKSGMRLNKNDAGRVDTMVFDSPLSTVTGALELIFGAGCAVDGVLFHTTTTEGWAPTEESALIYASHTRALKIGRCHVERQLPFHSTINLVGCRDTEIRGIHSQYQGNTFLRNNKSVGTQIGKWYSLDARQAGFFDVEFVGSASENVGFRMPEFADLNEENGTARAPIVNAGSPGAQEPLSGSYFFPASGGGSSTSATLGNNILRVYPVDIREVMSLAVLGAEITVAGEAGATFRAGIWTEKNGVPDKLLLDFGTIDAHTVAVADAAAGPLFLLPGRYFIGGAIQNAAGGGVPTMRTCNAAVMQIPCLSTAKPTSAAELFVGYMQEGVAGALGNWTAGRSIASSALLPRLHMKVA